MYLAEPRLNCILMAFSYHTVQVWPTFFIFANAKTIIKGISSSGNKNISYLTFKCLQSRLYTQQYRKKTELLSLLFRLDAAATRLTAVARSLPLYRHYVQYTLLETFTVYERPACRIYFQFSQTSVLLETRLVSHLNSS